MEHKLIYTEDHALIVSDEKIKENDWFFDGEDIVQASRITDIIIDTEGLWSDIKSSKKIIGHRPLKDAPILEEVTLLPEFGPKNDAEILVPFPKNRYRDGAEIKTWMSGWEEGFKEAKETYKYTENDLSKAIALYLENKSFSEIIQSLQQSKRPKYFESEMESYGYCEGCNRAGMRHCAHADTCGGPVILEKPKTTTNSQGQTELVGTYSF